MPGRLTIIEQIVHFSDDAQQPSPDHVGIDRRILKTDEQPWVRIMTVEETWTPLDTGWIAHPSLIVVSCDGKDGEKGTVEVAVLSSDNRLCPFAIVHDLPLRFEPIKGRQYHLYGGSGKTKVTIKAWPE